MSEGESPSQETDDETIKGNRLRKVLRSVLRYVLLLLTFGGLIVGLLVLRNGYLALFSILSGGSTEFTVQARYGFLDKMLLVFLAIATLAVVFIGDHSYSKARSIPDLLRRFARMAAWLSVVFFLSHGTVWIATGHRFDFSLSVPAAEAVLGSALFILSARRRAR